MPDPTPAAPGTMPVECNTCGIALAAQDAIERVDMSLRTRWYLCSQCNDAEPDDAATPDQDWRERITALTGGDDLGAMRNWLINADRYVTASMDCDEYGWWAHIHDVKDWHERDPDGLAETAEEAMATAILKRMGAILSAHAATEVG